MTGRDQALADAFRDKPDLVWPLPAWQLSPQSLAELRNRPRLAVVELAGRDSVAAALAATAEHGFSDLVPTYVYTGSEHGSWQTVGQAWLRLRRQLPDAVNLHPLLLHGSPLLWRALNGRYAGELIARHGLPVFCVGCHLYLHALRLPLALALGGAPIVAGERESHDGRVKINQLAVCLDAYRALIQNWAVDLILPLRQVAAGQEVEAWLGLSWPEGGEQLGCVLSGNYCAGDGRAVYSDRGLTDYLHDFALPLVKTWLTGLLAGRPRDPIQVASELLAVQLRTPPGQKPGGVVKGDDEAAP